MGSREERRKRIQEALLDANVGCLLAFVLIVGLPLVGVGAFFAWTGMSGIHEQARLNRVGVPVPATVVSSGWRASTTRNGRGTGSTVTSHHATVEYEYTREGRVRISSRIWPVGQGGSAAAMRDVAARFPAGAEVTAFVDPADPDVAFLEKHWGQLSYVAVVVGTLPVAFVGALVVLVVGWKRPGAALMFALVVGSLALATTGAAGWHYASAMPSIHRVSWMWLVLAGAVAAALGPVVCVPKARQLNRVYREGLAEAEPEVAAGR